MPTALTTSCLSARSAPLDRTALRAIIDRYIRIRVQKLVKTPDFLPEIIAMKLSNTPTVGLSKNHRFLYRSIGSLTL
jgi:hypothetical protein